MRRLFTLILLLSVLCTVNGQADTTRDKYVKILQGIADYSVPGVGIDDVTYLPVDHVRIDPESGRTYGRGLYTAASKIGPYLLFLLKVYEADGPYGDITMLAGRQEVRDLDRISQPVNNQTVALLRIYRALKTIRNVVDEENSGEGGPLLGGMVAWLSINPEVGALRDKDLVPLVDNGILSWSYAALLGELEGDEQPLAKLICEKIRELLDAQQYELFLNRQAMRFHGEIDVETGKGNPDYYLKHLWSEDMLAVLWGLLNVELSDEERLKIWDTLEGPTTTWETLKGEALDVPFGYIGSNHELVWTLTYLPLPELGLYTLFRNSQYAQADYAVRKKNPGFLGAAYDSQGAHMKMGIADLAQYRDYILRDDVATVFLTAPALLVDSSAGPRWLTDLVFDYDLLTPYGPLESIGPEGRADVLTADSQYITAVIIGGGVRDELKKYLQATQAEGSEKTQYRWIKDLFERREKQLLASLDVEAFRAPSDFLPEPPIRKYAPDQIVFPAQEASFEVLANLAEGSDDRHGSHVYSPKGRYMRWEMTDEGMVVSHKIPKDAERYSRFAWWGTYLGKERPYLAAYTDVEVTLKNDKRPHRFMLLLKREDTSLVKPILVDSIRNKGTVSEDGEEVTFTFPLKHRRRFLHLPLTYIAFSVEDPKKNKGFLYQDKLQVKSVRLVNRNQKYGKIDVRKAIRDIGPLPDFVPLPPRPPIMKGGDEFAFLNSGSIGEATEDITHEDKGVLYFEFEDADTEDGYAGIWTLFEEMELSDYTYLVFDVAQGLVPPAPRLLHVECKYQQGDAEPIEASWNVNLAKQGRVITRDKWYRIIAPLPSVAVGTRINLMTFIYENWVGKEAQGSLAISSPVLVNRITKDVEQPDEEDAVIRLSPELRVGEVEELMSSWQIQKIDKSYDIKANPELKDRLLHIEGKGGWFGAKLYPSMMASSLGNQLILKIQPVGDKPCSGTVELKFGPHLVLKTNRFQAQGSELQEIVLPLKFPSESSQVDYLVMSGVQGEFIIRDVQVTKTVPEVNEQEVAPESPQPAPRL